MADAMPRDILPHEPCVVAKDIGSWIPVPLRKYFSRASTTMGIPLDERARNFVRFNLHELGVGEGRMILAGYNTGLLLVPECRRRVGTEYRVVRHKYGILAPSEEELDRVLEDIELVALGSSGKDGERVLEEIAAALNSLPISL